MGILPVMDDGLPAWRFILTMILGCTMERNRPK